MRRAIYLLCCLVLLPTPLLAKDKHKDDDHDRGEHRGDYRGEHRGEYKSKKHKDLPPGWRKKLNKGSRVDDSIFVYMEPPSREVIAVLPPPPPGVSFRQIEDKIVKINDINRQIIEVLELDRLPIPKPPRILLPPLPR